MEEVPVHREHVGLEFDEGAVAVGHVAQVQEEIVVLGHEDVAERRLLGAAVAAVAEGQDPQRPAALAGARADPAGAQGQPAGEGLAVLQDLVAIGARRRQLGELRQVGGVVDLVVGARAVEELRVRHHRGPLARAHRANADRALAATGGGPDHLRAGGAHALQVGPAAKRGPLGEGRLAAVLGRRGRGRSGVRRRGRAARRRRGASAGVGRPLVQRFGVGAGIGRVTRVVVAAAEGEGGDQRQGEEGSHRHHASRSFVGVVLRRATFTGPSRSVQRADDRLQLGR